MPRRRHALLAVALTACGSSGSPGASGEPGGSAAGSAGVAAPSREPPRNLPAFPARGVLEAPKLPLPRQESFKLLSPGAAPRARLRYRLAEEPMEQVAETRLSSRTLEGGQLGAPLALPAIRDGFGVRHAAARPGELALRALAVELGAPARDAAGSAGTAAGSADAAASWARDAAGSAATQYAAAWRMQLQGRRATAGFDDRGRLGPFRFDDDPTGARGRAAPDELAQRLLATAVPLPEEPVGAGARWEAVTVLRQGPLFVKQTARYTLAARGASSWQLHVELRRVAEEQTVVDPALPKGTAADLLAMFRRLEGDVVVDPRHPLIERGTLSIESRLHVRLRLPGRPAVEQLAEDTGTITLSTRPQPP